MYVIKAQTFGHWGSWDDFVGIFETLDDALPRMDEHSQFYGVRLGDVTWEEEDAGLVYFNGLEYVALKVELS